MPHTLLFLHAASYTRAMWLPQLNALNGEFRTLAVDLPAHGTLAHQPFSLRASVETVLRALDDAQAESVCGKPPRPKFGEPEGNPIPRPLPLREGQGSEKGQGQDVPAPPPFCTGRRGGEGAGGWDVSLPALTPPPFCTGRPGGRGGGGEGVPHPAPQNWGGGAVLKPSDTHAERVVLVGASVGGCVGMLFASLYPERVAGLVLAGSTFNPCRPLAQMVLTGEGVVFRHGARRFSRTFEAWVRTRFPADVADEITQGGAWWDGAAQAVRALRGVDFRARLAAYDGPTLIVNGARDWVHRSSEASFASCARRGEVVVIPDAGHIPSLENPPLFTEAVRLFARQIVGSQGEGITSLPAALGSLLKEG